MCACLCVRMSSFPELQENSDSVYMGLPLKVVKKLQSFSHPAVIPNSFPSEVLESIEDNICNPGIEHQCIDDVT